MELIREIIFPTENTYLLKLPDEMVGKEIEVIVFEIAKKSVSVVKNELSDIQAIFKDNLVDLSGFKFNREEANNYDE